MKKLVIDLRTGWSKLKSLIKSGVSHFHLQQGISTVDEIAALAKDGKTALADIAPVVAFLPVNDTVKTEITKTIAEVAPVLGQISNPDIVNSLKTALAAEIVKIVTEAVTGQKVDPAAIEADVRAIFAADGITVPTA